jgi:prevent-host-death family protein
MPRTWQLQEAKNKLSELVESALSDGPQVITRRGEETVVVLSMRDFRRLERPKGSLAAFLARSPLHGLDLEVERDKDPGRTVDLGLSD